VLLQSLTGGMMTDCYFCSATVTAASSLIPEFITWNVSGGETNAVYIWYWWRH